MASQPFQVSFSPSALHELLRIKTWWRKNRLGNPSLFETEVEKVLLLIRDNPELGVAIRNRRLGSVRCFPLRRSSYVLFYKLLAEEREAIVVHLRQVRRRPLRARS